MKKYLALLLAVLMLTAMFAGCASKTEEPAPAATTETAATETTETTAEETAPAEEATEEAAPAEETTGLLAEIKAKGKLIVGITEFAPMDYQDRSAVRTVRIQGSRCQLRRLRHVARPADRGRHRRRA